MDTKNNKTQPENECISVSDKGFKMLVYKRLKAIIKFDQDVIVINDPDSQKQDCLFPMGY